MNTTIDCYKNTKFEQFYLEDLKSAKDDEREQIFKELLRVRLENYWIAIIREELKQEHGFIKKSYDAFIKHYPEHANLKLAAYYQRFKRFENTPCKYIL